MPTRDWRSAAAYADLEDAPLSDLAWEYLRRSPNYARAWEERERDLAPDDDNDGAAAAPWGLRFPRGSIAWSKLCLRRLVARCPHRRCCALCLAAIVLASIAAGAAGCEFTPPSE